MSFALIFCFIEDLAVNFLCLAGIDFRGGKKNFVICGNKIQFAREFNFGNDEF